MAESPKQVSRRRYSFGELADISMLTIAIVGLWCAVATPIVRLLANAF